MPFEMIEVAIVMQKVVPFLDAEGCDDQVSECPDRDTAPPQGAVVSSRDHGKSRVEHGHDPVRLELALQDDCFTLRVQAAQYLRDNHVASYDTVGLYGGE